MFLNFFFGNLIFFFLFVFVIFLLFYLPSGIKTIYFSPFYRYLYFLFLANISPSRIFFCPIFFILLPTKFSILFIFFFLIENLRCWKQRANPSIYNNNKKIILYIKLKKILKMKLNYDKCHVICMNGNRRLQFQNG